MSLHSELGLPEPESFESFESLSETIERVESMLSRFIVFPTEHGARAVALWVAFSHVVDEFDVAPYLLITAPEIESGKTRVMEVAAPLCARSMFSSSMTPAVLFRTIDRDHPTLFLDEADNVWTGRKDDKATELVALLNAGHRRGVKAQRMGGPGKTTLQEFDVFGPKAIAGAFPDVGNIPEALRSRSVHLRMQRKLPGEPVDRWTRQSRQLMGPTIDGLHDRLTQTLAEVNFHEIHIEPLEELSDRDFDIWEPLLAIAEAAGGRWPGDAHDAAVALCAADGVQAVPYRIQVLRDTREVWNGEPFMFTKDELLPALHALEDRPWGDFYGSPLTGRRLGQFLSSYGIESKPEPGETRRRGYFRQDLEDPWLRYAPQSFQTFQSLQDGAKTADSERVETFETLVGTELAERTETLGESNA